VPAADAAAAPPTGASSSTAPAATAPLRSEARSRRSRSGDVRADGEHQHHEAHVAEELHRGIRRVDRVERGAPDDHAREDLADHNRNEHSAPGAQQRARQTGEHNQRQHAKGHRPRLRRPDRLGPPRSRSDGSGCRAS
jgi:hypothetical protein